MDVETIKQEILAQRSTLNGDATDPQRGLIHYLTREAGYGCAFDDNPIGLVLFGDERTSELSKADAGRFISYFGQKTDHGEWKVTNLGQMGCLYREFLRAQGQEELFRL